MDFKRFLIELKRRRVGKAGLGYAVVAWLLLQLASILFPAFEAPPWVMKVFISVVVFGFAVVLVLAWAFDLTPEGIRRTGADGGGSLAPRPGRRALTVVISLAAAAAAILFVYSRFASAPVASERSLAVLPLVNQSGDAAQEYFSDGLSEELINSLGQIRELQVVGRNSSFSFKGKSGDSRAIARALGVANLLEGSVRRAGDRVRITVALVDAATGNQRWAQTYDREFEDIFTVQEQIARAVAEELRVTLVRDNLAASARPSNGSMEAYNAYLEAGLPSRSSMPEDIRRTITLLDEALRHDPNYAEAFALKALAWAQLGSLKGVHGRKELEEARAAAARALAIKPDLSRAKGAMAYIVVLADWNLPAAQALLESNADASTPRNMLANFKAAQGKHAEALRLQQQAVALDPVFGLFRRNLAFRYISVERYAEAETELRRALELQPRAAGIHHDIAILALLQGDPGTALQEARLETSETFRDVALALALAAGPDRAAADAALIHLVKARGEEAPFRVAGVFAFRREPDKVFEWLERAEALRDPRLITLLADPLFRPYYSDPRFADLCRRLGVPPPV